MGANFGFLPSNVSALSMYMGSAMALLFSKVDPNRIQLVLWWLYDNMLRHIHMMAKYFTYVLSVIMMVHRDYVLNPPP